MNSFFNIYKLFLHMFIYLSKNSSYWINNNRSFQKPCCFSTKRRYEHYCKKKSVEKLNQFVRRKEEAEVSPQRGDLPLNKFSEIQIYWTSQHAFLPSPKKFPICNFLSVTYTLPFLTCTDLSILMCSLLDLQFC